MAEPELVGRAAAILPAAVRVSIAMLYLHFVIQQHDVSPAGEALSVAQILGCWYQKAT